MLAVDLAIPSGSHVYAPGVSGCIPVDFEITPAPAYSVHPAGFPPAKKMYLKVIGETVPVYASQVRLLREVTIGKDVRPGHVTIDGTLRYQACDERECFVPETVRLQWALEAEALDRVRAAPDVRRR